jgi:mannose-6-phosphate isomerase-like protein (cupin superfamily)
VRIRLYPQLDLEWGMPVFIVLALLASSALAQDPPGYAQWSRSQLKSYDQKLRPKVNELRQAAEMVGDYGNHTAWVAHRGAKGEMEIHEQWADLMFVQTGEATLLLDAMLLNPRTTAPGEIRATSVSGGKQRVIRAGDVVLIPAGMPHQFLVNPKKPIAFFTMKIRKN